MIEPNFFIIGAPKCGTTALSEYLRTHPQVFFSEPKEPHFFASDFPTYRHIKSREAYLDLFAGAGYARAVGEGSVFYLYSEASIPAIRRTWPHAKLLVMLRNPIDLAVSMHAQALSSADEDQPSFARAWALCDERRRGGTIPTGCRDAKLLYYDQIPKLGAQMQRLFAHFPREQVRYWFFEDFNADPARVYCEALEFLGIDFDGRKSFERINQRTVPKSLLITRITERTPRSLMKSAMWLKRQVGIKRWGVLDSIRRFNLAMDPPPAIPTALRAEMCSHFSADIRLLAEVTGRNLDHWTEPREAFNSPTGQSVGGRATTHSEPTARPRMSR